MRPVLVEWRAGQPVAQRMRAGPRHPRRPRCPRDAARFDERGEEDALPGGGPVAAHRRGGGGLVGHRGESGFLEPI